MSGNTGELIRNSSIIIALNTTGLLEGMILDKNLITTTLRTITNLIKRYLFLNPEFSKLYYRSKKIFYFVINCRQVKKI